MSAQRDAFRPTTVPPFSVLQERRRAQARRRTAVAGAGLAAVGVSAVVLWLPGGQDTLPEAVDAPDDRFAGDLVVADGELARDHVPDRVDYPGYPARPPMGGAHAPLPQQCAVYTDPVPAENAVHSLEHGAAWVTYRPDLDVEQVAALAEQVAGDPYRLMSPLPGQDAPVVLTAWGRQLAVDDPADLRVSDFLRTFTNGPQTPERGAACVGSTATGDVPPTS
jgi:hypothetical protein